MIKFIIVIVAALIGMWFIIQMSGFRTIDSGEVGVVTHFGQVTGRVLNPGASFITPFIDDALIYNTKKTTYEASTAESQKTSEADYKDFPVDTNTADGQPVDIYYTIRFSVDPTKATWIAQNIGSETALVEKVVKTESRIWTRNIPRRFTAEQLYTGEGSQKVQNEIFEILKPTFDQNGLILDTVGIREIKFTDSFVQAIQAKQVAAIQVETEKNKAEQETFKKQQRITQAEGQAKEQELQRQTISAELLQKMWIEAWQSGGAKVPEVIMGGGNNPYILNLPQLSK